MSCVAQEGWAEDSVREENAAGRLLLEENAGKRASQ
jgi:hypothetical protein